MTKEDKQIIDRAVKEEWRIGDRTRLKHLLEKNLKLYRENVELENKIADIKANCDLAIEGRDIKIKELEEKHKQEILDLVLSNSSERAELEKENEELRNNGFTVSAMTEQQLKVALKKGEQLEKENAELKEKNRQLNNEVEDLNAYCNQIGKIKTDVLKLFENILAR